MEIGEIVWRHGLTAETTKSQVPFRPGVVQLFHCCDARLCAWPLDECIRHAWWRASVLMYVATARVYLRQTVDYEPSVLVLAQSV